MPNQEKILLAPSVFASVDKTPLKKLIQSGYTVLKNPHGRRLNKEELLKLLPGVSGIIAGLEPLDSEVLQKSQLKVISRCGSGLSNVDMEAAKKLKIQVCSTPFGPVESVAELTVGIMLCLVRNVFLMNDKLHRSKWTKSMGVELQGKAVSLLGFGRIGQRISQLLKPFGVKILAVDPQYKGAHADALIVSLSQALKEADIFSFHCSGDLQMIGESEFKLMKPGAYLLNVARGGVVNEDALIHALDQKIVAGAWIDCFQSEPYSGPLTRYSQVVLTPHVGSYTVECRSRMEMEAVDNLIQALGKKK